MSTPFDNEINIMDELNKFDDNYKLVNFTIQNKTIAVSAENRKTKQVVRKSLELKTVEKSMNVFYIDSDPILSASKIVWFFGEKH